MSWQYRKIFLTHCQPTSILVDIFHMPPLQYLSCMISLQHLAIIFCAYYYFFEGDKCFHVVDVLPILEK